MVKHLVQHGNSSALIIDKPILDLLKIGPETPLELTTDGTRLIISPIEEGKNKLRKSLERVKKVHGSTLRKLAK